MPTYAGSAWKFFNSFRLWEGDGTLDMDLDALWVSLHTSLWTPDVTKTVKADLNNEVANGAGGIYVTGGLQLTGRSFAQDSSTPSMVKLTANALSWAASGGSLDAMYAVLRAEVVRNGHTNPLIAYCALNNTGGTPATVSTASGQTLTLSFPNAIFYKQGGN